MRTKAILFDLDDTLIDTGKRHFNIVKNFINAQGKQINLEEYLNIRKKNNWSNSQIIKNVYSLNTVDFSSFWKSNIESIEYLKYDTEIVNSVLLDELKIKTPCDLILLSLRSNPESAEKQFEQFSFFHLFDKYHFINHSDLNPKVEKLKMYKKLYQQMVFVSDSQQDCKAAELAGVDFVGVQSGIYNLDCNETFENVNFFLLKQIEYGY